MESKETQKERPYQGFLLLRMKPAKVRRSFKELLHTPRHPHSSSSLSILGDRRREGPRESARGGGREFLLQRNPNHPHSSWHNSASSQSVASSIDPRFPATGPRIGDRRKRRESEFFQFSSFHSVAEEPPPLFSWCLQMHFPVTGSVTG